MNIKSTRKNYQSKEFISKCIKKIRNKSVDYKIRFIHLLILLLDLKTQDIYCIIDYAFYKNILKTDREVTNAEIEQLYDYYTIIDATKEINSNSIEEIKEYQKLVDKEIEYLQRYNEDIEREHKNNKRLSGYFW